MRAWSTAMNHGHAAQATKKTPLLKLHRLWPPFPGFEIAFGSAWSNTPTAEFTIDRQTLADASGKSDSHERCFAVVEQFMAAFEKARKLDAKIGVAVCVVPDNVWTNCRTESRVANPTDSRISKETKASRKRGQARIV
jgi:hypothetical protein